MLKARGRKIVSCWFRTSVTCCGTVGENYVRLCYMRGPKGFEMVSVSKSRCYVTYYDRYGWPSKQV